MDYVNGGYFFCIAFCPFLREIVDRLVQEGREREKEGNEATPFSHGLKTEAIESEETGLFSTSV